MKKNINMLCMYSWELEMTGGKKRFDDLTKTILH
jgi:hypothetical protein